MNMALLGGTSTAEQIENSDINIYVKDKNIVVDTIDDTYITIADITGRLLFKGEVCDYTEIPLHTSTPFVIARYTDGKSVKTKTILVQ